MTPRNEPGSVLISDEQLDRLADVLAERVARRVVQKLERHELGAGALVDPATLAQLLGVSRQTIYDHAEELGARRVGNGRRPRLRFDPDEAAAE